MARMACRVGMIAVWALMASGCANLQFRKAEPEAALAPEMAHYPPRPMVALERHPSNGKPKIEEYALEPGMTVGDLLEKTRANKTFSRMTVDLERTQGGSSHKMAVSFDSASNRVAHSSNYALHPRDRVIVRQDNSTVLDDLMRKVTKTAPKRR